MSPVFVNVVPPLAEALVAAARSAASTSADAARRTVRRCVDGLFMVGEPARTEVRSAYGTAANRQAHDGRCRAYDDVRDARHNVHVPCQEAADQEILGPTTPPGVHGSTKCSRKPCPLTIRVRWSNAAAHRGAGARHSFPEAIWITKIG